MVFSIQRHQFGKSLLDCIIDNCFPVVVSHRGISAISQQEHHRLGEIRPGIRTNTSFNQTMKRGEPSLEQRLFTSNARVVLPGP